MGYQTRDALLTVFVVFPVLVLLVVYEKLTDWLGGLVSE